VYSWDASYGRNKAFLFAAGGAQGLQRLETVAATSGSSREDAHVDAAESASQRREVRTYAQICPYICIFIYMYTHT